MRGFRNSGGGKLARSSPPHKLRGKKIVEPPRPCRRDVTDYEQLRSKALRGDLTQSSTLLPRDLAAGATPLVSQPPEDRSLDSGTHENSNSLPPL